MTQDDGVLHNFEEMDKDFFDMMMKRDNLTLADTEKLTEEEVEQKFVPYERIPTVDELKGKSRRVKRAALKKAYKQAKKAIK